MLWTKQWNSVARVLPWLLLHNRCCFTQVCWWIARWWLYLHCQTQHASQSLLVKRGTLSYLHQLQVALKSTQQRFALKIVDKHLILRNKQVEKAPLTIIAACHTAYNRPAQIKIACLIWATVSIMWNFSYISVLLIQFGHPCDTVCRWMQSNRRKHCCRCLITLA